MTALPPTYYLHVWWARRPLVASRAAILASLLPANADRKKFMHVLGIHGDPVATRRRIDAARRRGQRFEGQAYSYPRAFGYVPDPDDKNWLMATLGRSLESLTILDPTAGGGSVPFEVVRLGTEAAANDLNPVSTLIMRATVEWPSRYGGNLKSEFKYLSERFIRTREERLAPSPAPIATALCRYRRTGVSRLTGRASGSSPSLVPAQVRTAESVLSRSSSPPKNSRPARCRAATAPAPIPIAVV